MESIIVMADFKEALKIGLAAAAKTRGEKLSEELHEKLKSLRATLLEVSQHCKDNGSPNMTEMTRLFEGDVYRFDRDMQDKFGIFYDGYTPPEKHHEQSSEDFGSSGGDQEGH